MKRLLLLLFSCVLFLQPYCQAQPLTSEESPVTLSTATGDIKGRLLLPANATTCPVVLLIAGSGPTDMDGNNPICGFHSGEYLPPKKGRQAKPALRSKVMSYSFPEPFRSIPPKQGFSAIQCGENRFLACLSTHIPCTKANHRQLHAII